MASTSAAAGPVRVRRRWGPVLDADPFYNRNLSLRRPYALAFPVITAVGGALLLTHSHALSNLKDQMLIEMSHVPLALLGVAAGWTRWLELRLDARAGRVGQLDKVEVIR